MAGKTGFDAAEAAARTRRNQAEYDNFIMERIFARIEGAINDRKVSVVNPDVLRGWSYASSDPTKCSPDWEFPGDADREKAYRKIGLLGYEVTSSKPPREPKDVTSARLMAGDYTVGKGPELDYTVSWANATAGYSLLPSKPEPIDEIANGTTSPSQGPDHPLATIFFTGIVIGMIGTIVCMLPFLLNR